MSNCKTNYNGKVGTKASECFEMPVLFGILKRKDYKLDLDTLNNLGNLPGLNNAILRGDLLPLFEFHNPEDTSKERNLYESGSLAVYTDVTVKKLKAECHTTLCGHVSLENAARAGYEEFIEVTKDNKYGVVLEYDENEEFWLAKGQDISRLLVGDRKRPMDDKPPITEVMITYGDVKEFNDNGYYVDAGYSPFLKLLRLNVFETKEDQNAVDENNFKLNVRCGGLEIDKQYFTFYNKTTGVAIQVSNFNVNISKDLIEWQISIADTDQGNGIENAGVIYSNPNTGDYFKVGDFTVADEQQH